MIKIEPAKQGWILKTEQLIPAPLHETFEFFADAGNLERITPPFLNFQILTDLPIDMQEGALIDYQIRLRLVPIKWKTEISLWQPPHAFVDQQLRGPYKKWIHTHTFEPRGSETMVYDHVEYDVPGGSLVHHLMVKKDLLKIFQYRHDSLEKIFREERQPQEVLA